MIAWPDCDFARADIIFLKIETRLCFRTKALKKKNKLFRNFSKTGSKDGKKKEKLFHKRKSSKNEEGESIHGFLARSYRILNRQKAIICVRMNGSKIKFVNA